MASGLAIPGQKMTTVAQLSRLAVPTKKNDNDGTVQSAGGSRQENDGGTAQNPLMSTRGLGRLNVTAMSQQPGTAKLVSAKKMACYSGRARDKKSAT
jgi:hypothetical protein